MRWRFAVCGPALLSPCYLCLAYLLGMAAPAQSAEPVEREIVIVSDGSRDLCELEVYSDAGSGLVIGGKLRSSAYRQGGTVRVSLSDPGADRPLADLAVAASGSTPTLAGTAYGYPRLEFRLAKVPEDCLGDPSQVRVPPSLHSIALRRTSGGGCEVLVTSTSKQRVVSLGVEVRDADGTLIHSDQRMYLHKTSDPTLRLPVPGRLPEPGTTYDLRRRQLAISYCLFEDGSFEGDIESVKQQIASFAGSAAQWVRLLATLKRLNTATANEASLVPSIRFEVSQLPEFDPELEEEVVAKLASTNTEEIRQSFRGALGGCRASAYWYLNEYEAGRIRLRRVPIDRYWTSLKPEVEEQLEVYGKVLRKWLPDTQGDWRF
jgi:hypothetical protein